MSNHNKLLISIRDYLTRFQLQVKIATANSEYDLNQHAENIILPILDIIYEAKFHITTMASTRLKQSFIFVPGIELFRRTILLLTHF